MTAFGFLYRSFILSKERVNMESHFSRSDAFHGMLVLILSYSLSALLTFLLTFDWRVVHSIVSAGGWYGLYRYLAVNTLSWHRALITIAGWLTSAVLIFSFCNEYQNLLSKKTAEGVNLLVTGVTTGACGACLCFLFQWGNIHPFFSSTRSSFWQYIGRYSASFTDPNAWGVMGILVVPFLFAVSQKRLRYPAWLVGGIFLLFLPWSGSRTVWLGLGVILVLFGLRLCKKYFAQNGKTIFALAFSAGVLVLVIIGSPGVNRKLQEIFSAPGTVRVLKTLNWDEARQMLWSRAVFAKLAIAEWNEHKLLGVGLDRFYEVHNAKAEELGMSLQGWKDNANNFYLQILSEQGLLGFGLVLCAFCFFVGALLDKPRDFLELQNFDFSLESKTHLPQSTSHDTQFPFGNSEQRISLVRTLLAAMLIVLFVGPHLAFDEVRYFCSILFALGLCAVRPRQMKRKEVSWLKWAMCAAVLVWTIVVSSRVAQGKLLSPKHARGFYAIEQANGQIVRWVASRGRLPICGDMSQPLRIELRASNPDIQKDPVKVVFRDGFDGTHQLDFLTLVDNGWKTVELELPKHPEAPHITPDWRPIEIEVNRLWSPLALGLSQDARWLGVLVKWPEQACKE